MILLRRRYSREWSQSELEVIALEMEKYSAKHSLDAFAMNTVVVYIESIYIPLLSNIVSTAG